MGRKAEVRFPVDCRVRPPPPPRGTGKDGALPSVDHIGDRDRWSLCRMEYGVYAGGGHACMPLWNADGEFANGESGRTDGRTEGSFRNRKSRRFIIPPLLPDQLGPA